MSCVLAPQRTLRTLSSGSSRRLPRASLLSLSRPSATILPSTRHGSTIPPRSESFARPTEDHLKYLRSVLSSPSSLLSTIDGSATTDDLAGYNNDWMNKYHGKSPIVVKPKTTEEVSKVMKYCYDRGIAIVPQGGNTGLVGAFLPIKNS